MIAVTADQLGVIAFGSAFLLCCFYLAAYRPVIFVSFIFIIFTLIWRTCSMMYIDVAGPVYSSQTFSFVGPGAVTCLHVLAYFITIVPFFILFRTTSVRYWAEQYDGRTALHGTLSLSDLTFLLSTLFLAWLFVDLGRNGAIPLLNHMERFVYTAEHAGPAHRWLISYGNFLSFWWGLMFTAEKLRNRKFDLRYFGLFAVLVVYMFLTGNRFSAFYSFGSFFLIPVSALLAFAPKAKQQRPFEYLRGFIGRRELASLSLVATLLITVAVLGIYNNLTNVRGFKGVEVGDQFIERALVQPGELGWLSYQRVFEFGSWQPLRVFDFLFEFPIVPNRNTTPQYLMLTTIGEPRTFEHLSGGFQFAGGFPEIVFELFGPLLAWPFLAACGFITAGLTALIVKGTIQGRYASTFFALYVLYGFYVMYIGGMLNFAFVSSYWTKVGTLLLALIVESKLAKVNLPLLPWALFPGGKISDLLRVPKH